LVLPLSSDGEFAGGEDVEAVEFTPLVHEVRGGLDHDKLTVSGQGGPGLISEMFSDTGSRKCGVAKGV
jgi:hypothetical protein